MTTESRSRRATELAERAGRGDHAGRGDRERPFFVVGSARSGTTLVRVILDQHPRLSIPPESHFVVELAPPRWIGRFARPPRLDDILGHWNVERRWSFDRSSLDALRRSEGALAYPELVRGVFEAYAAGQGKPRWGDKTPPYVNHLPKLAALFPDARFVHVLRDGRDVAASMMERPWGIPHVTVAAFKWRRSVRRARRAARRLGDRYVEVRLEDLVADPEHHVRRICDFLDEAYDDSLLQYHERVPTSQEFQQLGPGFKHLAAPPTAGLRDWSAGLTAREQGAVEALCRSTLRTLGYDAPPLRPRAVVDAWLMLLRHLPRPVIGSLARPARVWLPRLWDRLSPRGRRGAPPDRPAGESEPPGTERG